LQSQISAENFIVIAMEETYIYNVTEIGLGFYGKNSAGRYEEIVNEEIEGVPSAS